MVKQSVIRFLRNIRCLKFAEKLRFFFFYFRSLKKIIFFKINNKNFPLPPYDIAYDAFSDLVPDHYIKLGKEHADIVSNLIKKYKPNAKSIYEWGCGPMRVLRQIPNNFPENKINYFGSDYNKKSVNWAQKNFPNIKISLNELKPPLPFDDNSFDVIYCISVFTHLSEELSIKYINDIYRILKYDGIFISTFHGDKNSSVLNNDEIEKFISGKFVERGNVKEGSRIFASYHPDQFLIDNFSKYKILEKIKCTEPSLFEQDWWVFQKKE